MQVRSLVVNGAILSLSMLMGMGVFAANLEPIPEASWPIKRIGRSELKPTPTDVVVVLRQTNNGWQIDQDASLSTSGTEKIWFRRLEVDGEIVAMPSGQRSDKNSGKSICTFGAASGGQQSREKSGYTECTSAFFSCETTWTDAALAIPFLLTATRTCPMQLDRDKVKYALSSAKVFDWLKIEQARLNLEAYRTAFSRITDPYAAAQFVKRYENEDPDSLIPQAESPRVSWRPVGLSQTGIAV